MLTGGKLATTTKLMEQGAIMMGHLRHLHMEETRHMEVEVRLMEEVVAIQVLLLAMKAEIIQLVATTNLFQMQEQDMAHLLALPTVDTLNRTHTSLTVNQVMCWAVHHSCSCLFFYVEIVTDRDQGFRVKCDDKAFLTWYTLPRLQM
jgi:hypothetical protein